MLQELKLYAYVTHLPGRETNGNPGDYVILCKRSTHSEGDSHGFESTS